MRAIFAIISAFISAKKFDLWVPSECVYELPDASFLCEYFRCVGRPLRSRFHTAWTQSRHRTGSVYVSPSDEERTRTVLA
jgi:hypothetical protein